MEVKKLEASKLESLFASTAPDQPRVLGLSDILPQGWLFWGVLEEAHPVGDGLVYVRVSGRERLVDESLLEKLQGWIGRRVDIAHIDGRWGAGERSAERTVKL
jgi:hypothetical protein